MKDIALGNLIANLRKGISHPRQGSLYIKSKGNTFQIGICNILKIL